MKIVDIFLAAPKVEARGVVATLFAAHGFSVQWRTPWAAQADRGFVFAGYVGLAVLKTTKFTVGAEVMEAPEDHCVVRLERRYLPTAQNQAEVSLMLADEFENLCDEVVLAFSSDGRVSEICVYGAQPLIVVDAHQAKPPQPNLPGPPLPHAPPPWGAAPAPPPGRRGPSWVPPGASTPPPPPPVPAAPKRYPPPPPPRRSPAE